MQKKEKRKLKKLNFKWINIFKKKLVKIEN